MRKLAIYAIVWLGLSCSSKQSENAQAEQVFYEDTIGIGESFREEERQPNGDVLVYTYDADSASYEQYVIRNGQLDDVYVQFYESGNIQKYLMFKGGKRHGESFYFKDSPSPSFMAYLQGNPIDTITQMEPYQQYRYYDRGKLLTGVVYDDAHQAVAVKGSFIEDSNMKEEYDATADIEIRILLIKPPYIRFAAFLLTDQKKISLPFTRLPNGWSELDVTPYVTSKGQLEAVIDIEARNHQGALIHTDRLKSLLLVK